MRSRFDATVPTSSGIGQGAHQGPFCFLERCGHRMTDKAHEIAALLTSTVQSLGLELLGVEYLPAPGGALLRLYIDVPADAEEGRLVGIEDCEAVSREVSAQMDVADPISTHYTLEVSSPGIERPLFTPVQFARFVGETAKVTLKLPQDGRRRLQGTIRGADDNNIVFDLDGNEFVVSKDTPGARLGGTRARACDRQVRSRCAAG
jgi:ribosome maturation factor RimP